SGGGMGRPMSCRIGLRMRPPKGAGASRRDGFEGRRMKRKKAQAIHDCTASTCALRAAGRLFPNSATRAPNRERIRTHKSMEPSWFPQTLVNLYTSGIIECEFS